MFPNFSAEFLFFRHNLSCRKIPETNTHESEFIPSFFVQFFLSKKLSSLWNSQSFICMIIAKLGGEGWKTLCETEEQKKKPDRVLCNIWA